MKRKNSSLPTSETVDALILAPLRKSRLVTRGKKLLLFQKVRPPRPPSLNVGFAQVSFCGGGRIRALAVRPPDSREANQIIFSRFSKKLLFVKGKNMVFRGNGPESSSQTAEIKTVSL